MADVSQPFSDDQLRRIEFAAWQRDERAYLIAAGKLRAPEPQPREPAQPATDSTETTT